MRETRLKKRSRGEDNQRDKNPKLRCLASLSCDVLSFLHCEGEAEDQEENRLRKSRYSGLDLNHQSESTEA